MEDIYIINLTAKELEIIYSGLLELPGKFSIPIMNNINLQLKDYNKENTPNDK